MIVFHLITGLGVGGAEIALCNFLEDSAVRQDQHVVAYFYDGPCVERLRLAGVTLYHIRGLIRGYDPLGFIQLFRLIKKIKPTIIHTSLWAANQVGRVLGCLLNLPVISELHGDAMFEGLVRNCIEVLTASCATVIVAVSDSVQDSHKKICFRYLPSRLAIRIEKKYKVIPNALKLRNVSGSNKFERSYFGLASTDFVIGSVGRLVAIKGYDVFLQALAVLFKQYPQWQASIKFFLVGSGPEEARLRSLVSRLNLENNVVMPGQILEVYAVYPLFDCFVQPSLSEGLSLALLEALAAGCSAIVTGNGFFHAVIDDGVGGYVVSAGDLDGLVDVLKKIFLLPQELRMAMGEWNKKKILHKFDYGQFRIAYLMLYAQLAKS